MEKIKIAITGLHGVLGSKLLQALPPDLKDNCVIYDLYHTTKKTSYLNGLPIRHTKLDLMNAESIVSTLRKIRPEVIIHLAAITHIDRCELEANNKNNSKSWLINVEATKKIVSFCKKGNTHLVFLSTECIFDGESDSFAENSKPNPKNWYGITKTSAEAAVKNSKNPWTIIRAVIAYDTSIQSKTIFSAIKNAFEKNKDFFAVSDQKFTPSYIPDIHRAIWNVVLYKHLGLIHISPQDIEDALNIKDPCLKLPPYLDLVNF